MPRLEDERLLRGEGRYTDDWHLPNEAYAAFVRSPHAHADILAIDGSVAAAAPGVLAVLTAADYLADGCVGIGHMPVPADTVDFERPAFGEFNGRLPLDEPQLPLAHQRVRYPGEAVAVVIAHTQHAARDAAGLVDVAYAVLPSVSDARAALAVDAPALSPDAPANLAVEAIFGDRSQTERALAESDVLVEHDFAIQRIANAQLEPRATIGAYDPEENVYLMIAGSQGVVRQRASLAAALKVPLAQVRVICPDVGGGFGPRTSLYPEQVVATWAAKRVGCPVRWTSDRRETFLTDFQGRDAFVHARLGLARDGQVHALALDYLFNAGAYSGSYVPLSNAARIATSVYDIPHASVRVRASLTNSVPTGPYRGAGRPEATFVLERLLDLAADRLALDRVALRERNLIRQAQLPYRSAMGLTYDSGAFAANMQHVLELADWSGFAARRQAARERGRLAGIGLANYIEAPVGAPHERVEVTVLTHGVVEVSVGTQSTGQGHATAFAQVVADRLEVTPEQVRLIGGDTARISAGGGTHSDRSMRLVGSLLVEACGTVNQHARELAAELLGAPSSEIALSEGVAHLGDPACGLHLFELAARGPLVGQAAFTGRMPAHPTGAAVCEVEVDPETGQVEVTRYTCVDDVGQPINPLIVEGQVHGGIVQGLGQALSEAVVFDPATAQVLTGSFLDYALLRAASLPPLHTKLAEDPTPANPLRIKGGGESGITPSLAVLVTAVLDALRPLGVTDLEMPLSPQTVWSAIKHAPQPKATGHSERSP
jgi:aerobic carbon-monoxide dehydrogenase large subunit